MSESLSRKEESNIDENSEEFSPVTDHKQVNPVSDIQFSAYEDMDVNPLNKVQVMSAFGSNLESDNMMAFDSSKDRARLETDQDDGRLQTD